MYLHRFSGGRDSVEVDRQAGRRHAVWARLAECSGPPSRFSCGRKKGKKKKKKNTKELLFILLFAILAVNFPLEGKRAPLRSRPRAHPCFSRAESDPALSPKQAALASHGPSEWQGKPCIRGTAPQSHLVTRLLGRHMEHIENWEQTVRSLASRIPPPPPELQWGSEVGCAIAMDRWSVTRISQHTGINSRADPDGVVGFRNSLAPPFKYP